MSNIQDIQITLPKTKNLRNLGRITYFSPNTECSIHVNPNQDWIVTGEYINNRLCAIKIQRINKEEVRE